MTFYIVWILEILFEYFYYEHVLYFINQQQQNLFLQLVILNYTEQINRMFLKQKFIWKNEGETEWTMHILSRVPLWHPNNSNKDS